VKLGGNEKHVKYVKTRTFDGIRGEICKSRGNTNFYEIGGNVLKHRKQGEITNL